MRSTADETGQDLRSGGFVTRPKQPEMFLALKLKTEKPKLRKHTKEPVFGGCHVPELAKLEGLPLLFERVCHHAFPRFGGYFQSSWELPTGSYSGFKLLCHRPSFIQCSHLPQCHHGHDVFNGGLARWMKSPMRFDIGFPHSLFWWLNQWINGFLPGTSNIMTAATKGKIWLALQSTNRMALSPLGLPPPIHLTPSPDSCQRPDSPTSAVTFSCF